MGNKADDYQIRDDVSWTKGAHQFKFGGKLGHLQEGSGSVRHDAGFVQLRRHIYTGQSTSPTCLLGTPRATTNSRCRTTASGTTFPGPPTSRTTGASTARLTLNLGLRWDGVPHTYEANNRMGNFYPILYNHSRRRNHCLPRSARISPAQSGSWHQPEPNSCGRSALSERHRYPPARTAFPRVW